MTSRERLLAVVAGEPVDQTPVIVYPEDEFYSDAAVISIKRLANAKSPSRIVMAEIQSPFARALKEGVDLSGILKSDPEKGNEIIEHYMHSAKLAIQHARESSVDGIFYHLIGAEPKYTTPMEYGGHYLEADRELLESASDARFNMIFVDGGPETYIDFVSDLPAHVFAWYAPANHIPVAAIRKMRKGILAAADPDADVLFGRNFGLLQQFVKKNRAETTNV